MPTQQNLTLTGDAGVLQAVLHQPDVTPCGIAVVAHPLPIMGGTMDNKVVTTVNRALLELGYVTLRFNFRGVGSSEGVYDEGNGEVQDAIVAANYLRQQYPHLPLLCAGFSFGGYVQARAAEVLQPKQLVLVAPAVGRFAMPNVPAHTLIFHGDLDEVVSLQDVLAWARPQQLPIMLLSGAEHYFHGRLMQLRALLIQQLRGLA